jgi:hypothetical protein
MAFGFKFGTSGGGAHRMVSRKRGPRAEATVGTAAAISDVLWEPLPPELEDWMGMNPYTGDQARTA